MSILLNKDIITRGEPIPVHLIGIGGTGSHMLINIAMIHYALGQMDEYGFDVHAYDYDTIEPVNIGRQMFLPNEIGENKATALIRRVNLSYGLHWHSYPMKLKKVNLRGFQIIISCVDSAKSRFDIQKLIKNHDFPIYWIDLGNSYDYGQIVTGYNQHKDLPFITEKYDIGKYEKPNEPSCSMSQSLSKQDLFMNKILADYAGHLLWKILRLNQITIGEFFINLDTLSISKRKV